MFRSTALAAVAVMGLSAPALASDGAADERAAIEAFTAQLTAIANQKEMRKLLGHQGYVVTSDLDRRDNGRWVGTALKDGQPVRVMLKMPPRIKEDPLTN